MERDTRVPFTGRMDTDSCKMQGSALKRNTVRVASILQLIEAMKSPFAAVIAVTLVASVDAQTRATQKRAPQPRRPPTETQIIVRDQSGMALQGARIAVSG